MESSRIRDKQSRDLAHSHFSNKRCRHLLHDHNVGTRFAKNAQYASSIKHQASSEKRVASDKVQSAGKQNEEKLWESREKWKEIF
eukprot:scaffold253_cov267-Chaetoceros_neogracile.AAC.12